MSDDISFEKAATEQNDLFQSVDFASKYKIKAELGRGASSIVYCAEELVMARLVAIKVLNSCGQPSEKINSRFLKEAQLASRLQHTNIAQIYSFGWLDESQPYIVMEHLQGKDLSYIFKHEGLFNQEKFELIFLQVMDALEYSHQNKIVHCDLKPGNIIVLKENDRPVVKLLDFGISRLTEQSVAETVTTGFFSGTPLYMSPEQCTGKSIDARSDIYSLACVMYESLAGKPPFTGDNATDLMYKHANEQAAPLDNITAARQIPSELAVEILRALSKEPDKRPGNMAEFRTKVRAALASRNYVQKKRGRTKKPKLQLS